MRHHHISIRASTPRASAPVKLSGRFDLTHGHAAAECDSRRPAKDAATAYRPAPFTPPVCAQATIPRSSKRRKHMAGPVAGVNARGVASASTAWAQWDGARAVRRASDVAQGTAKMDRTKPEETSEQYGDGSMTTALEHSDALLTAEYQRFLERKAQSYELSGFEPTWIPDFLFPFQQYLTDWALRMGRAAIYADCGLGKSPMALVWAANVVRHTCKPVLMLTPLGVSFQMLAEAHKFGIDASISRDGSISSDIVITNYERLIKFNPDDFGGAVCDESSAIKAFDGVRRTQVTEFLRRMPYRLLGTATAAPNDYIELGTSSEALGYLGHTDMLSRFFTNKERTVSSRGGRWRPRTGEQWRFKGHAEDDFWRWVSSWARTARKPSDLGFSDAGYLLPALIQNQHLVEPSNGDPGPRSTGFHEERRRSRLTLEERCDKAERLLFTDHSAIAWCQLNTEGELLRKWIRGAVEVSGNDSIDAKEEKLAAFSRGEIRVLVTKPSIGAWGMNWQHCSHMTYFPSYSYEQYYQAVRRCWRFGQEKPVVVDVVTTDGGRGSLEALQRKSAQADRMFDALTFHMRNALSIQRTSPFTQKVEVPSWATC